MHGDYVDAIIRAYHHIAVTNPRFVQLRRDGLKAHCKAAFRERFSPKDEILIRTFFDVAEGQNSYLRAIERCSADKFRPLVSILKKETANPKQENVELLAWMFEIEPRPYDDKFDYTKIYNEPLVPATRPIDRIPNPMGDGPPSQGVVPVLKLERKWRVIAIIILFLISSFVGFTLLSNKRVDREKQRTEGCMYWAGDRYETGPCIQRGGDSITVPLDLVRLRNFKRITDTSLISFNSIGKVWYCITNGKFEFYTTKGEHPLDKRDLRRLTQKSYDKYLKSIEEQSVTEGSAFMR